MIYKHEGGIACVKSSDPELSGSFKTLETITLKDKKAYYKKQKANIADDNWEIVEEKEISMPKVKDGKIIYEGKEFKSY